MLLVPRAWNCCPVSPSSGNTFLTSESRWRALTLSFASHSDSSAPAARTAKSLTESDIVGENREEKTVKLFDATLDAASNFMSSHNLEVKFPKEMTANFARSIDEGKRCNSNLQNL